MRNLARAIVLLLALGLSEPVLAGPLEDARAAYGKEDYTTALRLFRPLADQGDADAQSMLGLMYDNGQGVPKDYAQAVKWYRLAANQGYASAQANLGNMYYLGQGVPKDYVLAYMWRNLAAGGASDADIRERAVKARDELAKVMTSAQVAEAQKRASAWQPK